MGQPSGCLKLVSRDMYEIYNEFLYFYYLELEYHRCYRQVSVIVNFIVLNHNH